MAKNILLVEDGTAVRNAIRYLLSAHCDTILDVGSGEEALQVCEQYEESIHLSIVDIILPGMDGLQLAERLTSLYPEMQVLYMSAYPDEFIEKYEIEDQRLIRKPFDLDTFMRKVSKLLAGL